jgi:hypothetical protein
MRPTGHLHSTTIGILLLFQFVTNFDYLSAGLFLLGSMSLDVDFLLSHKFFKNMNHRLFITHSPLLYIILIIICYFYNINLIWFFLGSLFHLIFDTFDWGLYLLPISDSRFLTAHILTPPAILEEKYFFERYFGNKYIKTIEILLGIGFIISIIHLPIPILIIILFFELGVIIEFGFQTSKFQHKAF